MSIIATSFVPEFGVADVGAVMLTGRITIGSTGAITTTVRQKGMTITNSATGTYTLTLQQGYAGLLFADAHIVGTYTTTDGTRATLSTDNSVLSGSVSTPTVVFTFTPQGSATATDVKSGNDVVFVLFMKNGAP